MKSRSKGRQKDNGRNAQKDADSRRKHKTAAHGGWSARLKRIARWTVLAVLAFILASSIAGALLMRDPLPVLMDRKAHWPSFIWASVSYFGDRVLFLTDAMGLTGSDTFYSYDMPPPAGEIFFAGAPQRVSDPAPKDIKVIERGDFTVGWSAKLRHPVWVAYHVPAEAKFPLAKRPPFRDDPGAMRCPSPNSYSRSGFDRGHMAPNHAMSTRFGEDSQKASFLMTNISPQTPNLNRGAWREMERLIADFWTERYGEIWVIVGALPSRAGSGETIPGSDIDVPPGYYMVIVAETVAENAPEGEPYEVRALAVKMPQDIPWRAFPVHNIVSIDEIERETGLDFLPDLPDFIESPLEAETPTRLWPVKLADIPSLILMRLRGR